MLRPVTRKDGPAVVDLVVAAGMFTRVVGLQALEADDFAKLRTVDTGSYLAVHARGRGTAVAMRTAILGLAFDHLGAVAAISSARADNAPSLAVSRRLGIRRERRPPDQLPHRRGRAAAPAADPRELGGSPREGHRSGRLPGVVRRQRLTSNASEAER